MATNMIRPWSEIIERYTNSDTESLKAIGSLCESINAGPYGRSVHSFTSMGDLCICKTPNISKGATGPILKFTAINEREVEYRYIDTFIEGRQWYRVVPSDQVTSQFYRFAEQLNWFEGDGSVAEP